MVYKQSIQYVFSIFFLIGAFFCVATASAQASSYVWNNHGRSVPMQYAPTNLYNNVKLWIPNGTRFDMKCWEDFQWYTGNYSSNRWFWGQEYSSGYFGYVHSSYVYNQTRVPHC